MKTKSISWWFVPLYYPYSKSKLNSTEAINNYHENLKLQNNDPGFIQKLTPAKILSSIIGGLGILSFLGGLFNGNSKITLSGALGVVIGVLGFFSDRFLIPQDNSETDSISPETTKQEKADLPKPTKKNNAYWKTHS